LFVSVIIDQYGATLAAQEQQYLFTCLDKEMGTSFTNPALANHQSGESVKHKGVDEGPEICMVVCIISSYVCTYKEVT
jgi:hypothetical protein